MGKNIKLNSSEWIDFVFAGKNRAYGAYRLRDTSGRGHVYALLIVLVLTGVLVTVNHVIYAKKQQQRQEQLGSISTTVELTNIDDLDVKLPEETVAVEEAPPPPKLLETMMFTAPVIEDDDKVSADNRMKSQKLIQQSTTMISLADIEGSKDLDAMDLADMKQAKIDFDKEKMLADNKLYDKVDQMPRFPGGPGELAKFIAANLRYPQQAIDRGVEGQVLLRFVVEKDGSIADIRVLQSVDPACDAEAMRVIRMMPRWEPGKHNGRAVRVWFTQPIAFELR